MQDCQSCNLDLRVTALEEDMKRNQGTHKEFHTKFETYGKEQAVTNERYRNILDSINELKVKVENLNTKPAKRWDSLVSSVISASAGGLIGFVLSSVLK